MWWSFASKCPLLILIWDLSPGSFTDVLQLLQCTMGRDSFMSPRRKHFEVCSPAMPHNLQVHIWTQHWHFKFIIADRFHLRHFLRDHNQTSALWPRKLLEGLSVCFNKGMVTCISDLTAFVWVCNRNSATVRANAKILRFKYWILQIKSLFFLFFCLDTSMI